MYHNKRSCSWLCSIIYIILVVSSVFAQEMAPLNPEFIKYQNKKLQPSNNLMGLEYKSGVIPSPIEPEIHIPGQEDAYPLNLKIKKSSSSIGERSYISPLGTISDPSYDLRTEGFLTSIRDQGTCGSCWAFATYASLESYLKKELGLSDVQNDYSENNLNNYHGFDNLPCDGGNHQMSTAYFARTDGPVSETDDPYDLVARPDCSPTRFVDNWVWMPDRSGPTDLDYIKQAILDYGALYTCYYHNDSYYRSADSTYYYSGSADTNHCISIVGWDDNKDTAAASNGAFICRNSWGGSWGESGYYYISYYDSRIAYYGLGHPIDLDDSLLNFDKVYYHDELGMTGSAGWGDGDDWGANKFVAQSDGNIKAVGFYSSASGMSYEIRIYDNMNGTALETQLGSTQTGSVQYRGYYTVPLDTEIPITNGNDFFVAVRFNTTTGTTNNYPVPVESPITNYSSSATASAGEGYASSTGSSYSDITTWGAGFTDSSVCIKAFTGPAGSVSLISDTDKLGDPAEFPTIDIASADQFGRCVAIDENIAVIGAPYHNNSTGAAYVFEFNAGSWTYLAKLTSSDAAELDRFGTSVSICGDDIIVGAPVADGVVSDTGVVYVYEKPIGGWEDMTQTAKLIASKGLGGDRFGNSVANNSEIIAVGAYGDDTGRICSGAVYVYQKSGANWTDMTETAKMKASDRASYDYLGFSVAVSGQTIAAGVYRDDTGGTNAGSIYLFEKPLYDIWRSTTETAVLRASDASAGDKLGYSVAFSMDTLIAGAIDDDDNGTNSGSAYVFVKPQNGWSNGTETAKLISSDGAEEDKFGKTVSIYGDVAVIGVSNDDDNDSNSGSAYIFEKDAGGWANMTETEKITAFDARIGDQYGRSVFIAQNIAVIGSILDDVAGYNSGSAYSYVLDITPKATPLPTSTPIPTNEFKVVESLDVIAGDQLGRDVAVNGNTAVVGAPYHDGVQADSGSAYVYERIGDSWSYAAKLTPSVEQNGALFGWSVAVDGDTIVIGARKADVGVQADAGAVYVFEKPLTGWTDMTETALLTASDIRALDKFGNSVAISGDTIAVGSSDDDWGRTDAGSIYVFEKPGANWVSMTQTAKLWASDREAYDNNGFCVAIDGNTIVSGAYRNDDAGASSGSVYIFEKPGINWVDMVQTAKLTASDAAGGDKFGMYVSISGDTVAIGAYYDDDNGYNSGSVYIYVKSGANWTDSSSEDAKLQPSDGSVSDGFGRSVGICGDTVLVGSIYDDDWGDNSGSAYIFEKPGAGWSGVLNEERKICAYDANKGDIFGWCVAICTDYMIIGCPYNDDNGSSSGAAYLYDNPMAGGGGGEMSPAGAMPIPLVYSPTATVISNQSMSDQMEDIPIIATPTPTVTPTPVSTYTPTPTVTRSQHTVQQ